MGSGAVAVDRRSPQRQPTAAYRRVGSQVLDARAPGDHGSAVRGRVARDARAPRAGGPSRYQP